MGKNNTVSPVNGGPTPGEKEKKTVSAIQMKKLQSESEPMEIGINYKTTCDEAEATPMDNEEDMKRAQEILALSIRTKQIMLEQGSIPGDPN